MFAGDANPFLPVTEAQRMMGGSYPDVNVARASLAQMNEISRRAEVAGLSFNPPLPPQQQQQQQQQQQGSGRPGEPSMNKIFAAAAGLMPERPLSAQDTLARIGELSRARPTSAQGGGLMSSAGMPPGTGGNTLEALAAASANAAAATVGGGGGGGVTTPVSGIYTDASDPYGAMLAANQGGDERYGVPLNSLNHEGLQVFTVGHLMPKSSLDDGNGNWSFDPSQLTMPGPSSSSSSSAAVGSAAAGASQTVGSAVVAALDSAVVMPTPQGMGGDPAQEGEDERQQPIVVVPDRDPSPMPGASGSSGGAGQQKLRVRRSTYVPGWAVPPRVLLVDDDAISRKLSSKFLQVFGCTIDVAVDGDVAVSKMNLEKHDLVLMVRTVVFVFLYFQWVDGLFF